jgi:CBS domain-containing protein
MSPRAAWRLEAMGFEQVYDYEDGKRDWGSFGLPREGTTAEKPSAGDVVRRDVPTCKLDDDLDEVRDRVRKAGWDTCFVVTDDAVVLGRIGRRAIAEADDSTIEDVMSEGPSTVRPSIGIDALLKRMDERKLHTFPVTTPDGKLVGLVLREDAEQALGGSDLAADSHGDDARFLERRLRRR